VTESEKVVTVPELLIVRLSSHLRATSEAEILTAVAPADLELPRQVVSVDLAPFESDVEGGYWESSHAFIRKVASDLRVLADGMSTARVIVGGIAEIPHVVALGAYFGDERLVEVHDFDRDRGTWAWGESGASLQLDTVGLPNDRVTQAGSVVLRLEISNAINDSEVRSEVGDDFSADISVRPVGEYPLRGAVRSAEDVESVRVALRKVFAAIEDLRPNATMIHLFVAAPISVSFVLGQELHLRSGTPAETYRHRVRGGENPYRPAIRLSASALAEVESPLTEEEVGIAGTIRAEIWPRTLRSLTRYARAAAPGIQPSTGPISNSWLSRLLRWQRQVTSQGVPGLDTAQGKWYSSFAEGAELLRIDPFPGLAPLVQLVSDRDGVDPEPRLGNYGFDKDGLDGRLWRLPDPLLVAFHRTVDGDSLAIERLIRLFLFHEYLHDWQVLTKYTAADVGAFANGLERVDYTADTYAILHEHDYSIGENVAKYGDEQHRKDLLAHIIDLVIRSFWAFEPAPPNFEWQERRLRRYLNWFWRRVQVRRAPSLGLALTVLSEPPSIEVTGLERRVGRGRSFVMLNRISPEEHLEIGLVLEDGRFYRTASVGNMSIEALLNGLATHDHDAVSLFFNSLFENVRATNGHLPSSSK